mmetsp:Transcript_10720/g.25744  ORF Transcript_10720/g.25744 Transcript_10720/m.25744 type:complete len:106 (+) Transcript_10720:1147-1464(+)
MLGSSPLLASSEVSGRTLTQTLICSEILGRSFRLVWLCDELGGNEEEGFRPFLPYVLDVENLKFAPFANGVHVALLWRPDPSHGMRQLVDVVASGMHLVGATSVE